MNWVLLIIAGLFEVGFTTCLSKAKHTHGTEHWVWLGAFLVSLGMSMYLLFLATRHLPLGTAYSVWTGVGAVGTVLVSIIVFKEPTDWLKMLFIFTLIGSIVGLKLVSQ